MKYPDGKTIKVGDVIWVDEGSCIGRVAAIIEAIDITESDYISSYLDEPSIGIDFDVLAISMEINMYNSEAQLEDEGIGLVSEEEWDAELLRLMEKRKKR